MPRPTDVHVTLFRATALPLMDGGPARWDWRHLAKYLDVVPVPGDHEIMRQEPAVHDLAAALNTALKAAQQLDDATP